MDQSHKNLYYLCTEFYKYEELLKKQTNSNDNEGYLIEKTSIEQLKQNIFYEQLKPYSDPKLNKLNVFIYKPEVKKYLDEYKGIERNIIQVKFKNGEKLIKSLNDNKKYYLINKALWNRICKTENIYDKGISILLRKNNIILYFNNQTEKLYFKINDGIIEKESFIENKSIYNKSIKNENISNKINISALLKYIKNKDLSHTQFNDNNKLMILLKNTNINNINNRLDILNLLNKKEDEDSSFNQNSKNYNNFNNIEFQEEEIDLDTKIKNRIEITLSLYSYEKDFGHKINYSKNLMNEGEYNNYIIDYKGYLINKNWMDKFKKIYLYDIICEYLKDKNLNEDTKKNIFFNYKNQINNINNNDLKTSDFNVYPESLNLENYKNIFYFKNFYIINPSIYDLLKKKNILNDKYLNNLIKIDYIINDGKIIFKFVYNECNNIFIYKQSDNYIFIPEIIIYFHSKKNEMDDEYENFKINKNIKYDINNRGNNNNFIQVESFYLYDAQSKIKVSKIKDDNQLNKKPIEFLLNIYLTRKDIENKIERSLKNTSIEKYSIIKKESMNKILNYFGYNIFVDIIKENIIGKNEEEILDEIMNKFYNNEYLMNLNNKIKIKTVKEALKNIKKLNENDIDYNKDDIEIINDKVKNFIHELIGDINIEDRKFLFGDQKIIMDYKFVKKYFLIGNFENSTFKPEIMLHFEQETGNYFSIFQTKGYNDFINEVKLNNNCIITSKNQKIKEIKIKKNYQFSPNENDINEGNTNNKLNHDIHNDIQNRNLSSSNNNKNIINNGENNNSNKDKNEMQSSIKNNENNKNANEIKGDDMDSQQQFFSDNTNDLNPQYNKLNTDIEEGIISEADKEEANDGTLKEESQKTLREFSDSIKKPESSSFTEIQIKALILYYFFYLELEKDVKNSNIEIKISECYLISTNWMKKFKEFYLYEKLVNNIKKIKQKLNVELNLENIDKIIYDKLDEEYLKEVNEKEADYPFFLEDKNNILYSSDKIKDEEMGEIKYYYGFDILSIKVYNLIVKRKNISLVDLTKNDYLINDEKIIIKFEEEIKIKLLVGHFDFINHQYIHELFFYYYLDKNKNHYEYLKNNHYNKFKKEKIDEKKYLLKGSSNIYIGKIIELNNQNNGTLEGSENKKDNKIISQDNPQTTLNLQSKNNIEFLLRLYFCYKTFKEKFNNPIINLQIPEKGYIINKDLIEKYKEYYNYKELIKLCESKQRNIKSNEEFENLNRILPNEYIKEIVKKDNNSSTKDEFYNSIQNIKQISYPDNCVVLNEDLNNLLYNYNDSIQRNKNKIEIQYFIGDKKLIIIYNKKINIGNIDENYAFKLNEKYSYDTKEQYNHILNKIKNIKFVNLNICDQDFNRNKNKDKSKENIINYEKFLTKKDDASNIKSEKNILKGKNRGATPGNNINIMNQDFYFMNLSIERMNTVLKNILSIIIDSEKIKYKMKMPLNYGNIDEYYLLNYDWFKKYLELNNANNVIYDHLVNLVKSEINISNISNNKIKNEMIINNIIPTINSNIKMKIKKEKENYYRLQDNKLCNVSSSTFVIKGYITLKYYYNFIIISPETMNLLMKDFSFQYGKNSILFGDNKAFIKRKKQLLIEICFIDNKNIFIPELFFYFDKESILNNNLNLLQNEGYDQYFQYNLLFNNDYTSPIFDKNNDNIGYAFKYEPSIKNYSIYQLNDQLKEMIKMYFSKALLKNKLNYKELLGGKYFIIDTKYIQKFKELFDYNNLEKELNNNAIAKQAMNLLEKNTDKFEYNILNNKKISLIIKNLPEEININYNKNKFNNKIECQEIPNLIPFNNTKLFYYINFELVDVLTYFCLFDQDKNFSDYEEKENYLECYFIEKLILINISNNNNIYILEVCIINDNNNINPLYLLEYDNKNNFIKHIKYVKSSFGIKIFFESLDFTSNNRIEMNDENDQKIGNIYNLGINQNLNSNPQSINNQNLNKISNVNYQKSDNMNKIPYEYNNVSNIIKTQTKGMERYPTIAELSKNFPQLSNDINNRKIKNINNPDNNQQVNEKSQIKSVIECFPFPPKIGLQNVGATCYMNATLQCFCNILLFVDFFKFNSKVEETINKYLIKRKLCLTSSFKTLIDNLWPYDNKILINYCGKNTNNRYFIPKEFKNKISKMDDLFKGVAANDSKDLVNFIIMTLHEELNEAPKGPINNNIVNNQNINLYNNYEVLQYFLSNFQKENSIISKEFYAVNHTLTKCSICQLVKNNYQTYFFLIFPLEEIRKYKLNQMKNMCQNMFNVNPFLFQQNLQKMQNTNSVTLEDCFNYNEKIDTFQGQNAMFCNICKAQLTSFYQTKLYTGPEILIIVLNRGKGIEFRVKLEFDLFIDITNYVEVKYNKGWKYELIGVVTHLGESGASGHFIAYCKSPIGGGWYQYNDELVFEVKDFAKEIRDYAMPYILFYQKINN